MTDMTAVMVQALTTMRRSDGGWPALTLWSSVPDPWFA